MPALNVRAMEYANHLNEYAAAPSAEEAALYYTIVEEILGADWLTTDLFRIGASSAANNILSAIEGHPVKYY